MKARACQLFEVCQHEFANFSLPCEGRLRLAHGKHYLRDTFPTGKVCIRAKWLIRPEFIPVAVV